MLGICKRQLKCSGLDTLLLGGSADFLLPASWTHAFVLRFLPDSRGIQKLKVKSSSSVVSYRLFGDSSLASSPIEDAACMRRSFKRLPESLSPVLEEARLDTVWSSSPQR
jgi:hypothetical protein